MKFLDKKRNEIKDVYSIEIKDGKAHIVFNKNGREYIYLEDNIELILGNVEKKDSRSFIIYKLMKQCYKCSENTTIITYIVFNDNTNDDVVYPWDKQRLLKNQNILDHMMDSSIEYYGLKVLGYDEILDLVLANKFPDKIKSVYSKIQNRKYYMNVCEHCAAGQGSFHIYHQVNTMIQKMERIDVLS